MRHQQAELIGERRHVAGDNHRIWRAGIYRQQHFVKTRIRLRLGKGFDKGQIHHLTVAGVGLARLMRAYQTNKFQRHHSLLSDKRAALPAAVKITSSCGIWIRPHSTLRRWRSSGLARVSA